ncbi:glycosyltransferase family 87 protein [Nubsella zeaxanthinifaciens]|uniref:glycosyltransferase family 87 protein n=1 Tax=Nubsella zeaxanthinifaciens TaxID=392412 RepID=UPI000DE49940|nr:glycosyltransferase family 87 protein [Nubsella zeaxanthinifaciens]
MLANQTVVKTGSKKYAQWALSLWLSISIYCFIQSILRHRLNNYLIFENTFFNLIGEKSLYNAYPTIHDDANHYGPIFGLFIAPVAMLPRWLGFMLWNIFNCVLLFWSIKSIKLPNKNLVYFIALPCLASSMLSQQFNPATAAFIIFTYTLRDKHNGFWSAFLIALGTMIKLYGIVGLAFFFFIKDKKSFITYLIMWFLILFFLPMLVSSPTYIVQSYKEWSMSLAIKNATNIGSLTNDISIMGFVRNLVARPISNTPFLIVGCLMFALSYLNFSKYKDDRFQLLILASVLIFPVLFSSGSEDCTYIVAIAGVGIWYLLSDKGVWRTILLAAVILVSFDFPLMVFPDYTTQHPFAIKMISLPYFLVWLKILAATFKLRSAPEVQLAADQQKTVLL